MNQSSNSINKTHNSKLSTLPQWMAGLSAGAVGISGVVGVDEAYGAIQTLDNGGAGGWSLSKPGTTTGTTSISATLGFGLKWYNPGSYSLAYFSNIVAARGLAFIRNSTSSITPGTPKQPGGIYLSYNGIPLNGVATGNDNWLAIKFSDAIINSNTPTTGWLQLSSATNTLTILRIVYSDAPGGIVHLDGKGEFTEEIPPTPAPEPSSLALLAAGAGGILAFRRRRNVAKSSVVQAAA